MLYPTMAISLKHGWIGALTVMVACSSASKPSLEREVRRLAFTGEGARQAESALETAGFHCGSVTAPAIRAERECDRTRGYWVLASCVQRAYLTLDATRQKVYRTDVLQPACTGL